MSAAAELPFLGQEIETSALGRGEYRLSKRILNCCIVKNGGVLLHNYVRPIKLRMRQLNSMANAYMGNL